MPSENTEQRKLAAIMFTDMVGYSALSQRNEALALELLAENQRLLRTQFPLFNSGGSFMRLAAGREPGVVSPTD